MSDDEDVTGQELDGEVTEDELEPEPEDPEPEPESAPAPPAPAPKPTLAPPPAESEPASEAAPASEAGSTAKPKPKKVDGSVAGRPSKLPKEKLMVSEGIIPIQSGTNKWASQKGATPFGAVRDVNDHTVCTVLEPIEEGKQRATDGFVRGQSGSNKFDSQRGMASMGGVRDVNYKPISTLMAEVPEEKARSTDGIIPLQSGTNKLASQAGMTGIGMPRIVDVRNNPDQDSASQGFIHLQMGTNRFASKAGMTDFGAIRTTVTKVKDEARSEIPFDESVTSRQTIGSSTGANQNGMTGFGMPRRQVLSTLRSQNRKSQGMVPYQMGINWADSQAGKTPFGASRNVFTSYIDDTRPELPEELARDVNVPKWNLASYGCASQAGTTGMGMPRDVKGHFLRRLW